MSQEIINIGASANDGQGDPIRTAFAKTNNNFTQLFGIGASQIIYNGTSNVNLPFLNGNVYISVAGVGNVMVVDSGGANISGTLAVTGNVTGGNLLTGGAISSAGTITGVTLVGDYVQGIVTTPTQTQITSLGTLTSLSVSGNVNPGNLTTTGIVSAAGAILAGGNVSGLNLRTPGLISATGGVTAGNVFSGGLVSAAGNIIGGNMSTSGDVSITGNLTVSGNATLSGNILGDRIQNGTTSFDIQTQNGNANITVGGTSNVVVFANTGVYANGVISATGNIAGSYFIGNGSQLTGLPSTYGNTEMVANLAALGSNPVSTTGNVTGGYIFGNGSQLTSIPPPVVTQDITSVGNMSIMTYDGTIKYVSYVTIEPASGNVNTSGNITGGYFIGNGSQLTGISGGGSGDNIANGTSNVIVVSSGGNISVGVGGTSNVAVFATTGEYVTGLISATGNIRSGGNISAVGSIQGGSTGNVYGGNLRTTGYASAAGNVIGGNIITGGLISATGNIYAGNIDLTGAVVTTGAAGDITMTGGNITGANVVSATGNITGNYFIGNGSQLTGVTATTTAIVNGNSYANIATASGNLEINVGSDGYGIWNFVAGTGNLVGPGNATQGAGIVFSADQSVYIREDMGELNIDAESDIVITTNSGNVGNTFSWTFDPTGNLTLPDAGGLGTAFGYTALKGGSLGALVYQDTSTFMGVDNHGSITLTANNSSWILGNATNDGNAVMLLPGDYKIYQPGVSILSIEAPANTSGVSLNYLGGTSLTVGNISNVNVVTVTNTGNSWTFKADGVTQCPLVSVDDLPSALTPGQRAMVFDASNDPTTSFGQIVGNVGSNVLPVFSDGTDWRVG
jgi:hypothetical protein